MNKQKVATFALITGIAGQLLGILIGLRMALGPSDIFTVGAPVLILLTLISAANTATIAEIEEKKKDEQAL